LDRKYIAVVALILVLVVVGLVSFLSLQNPSDEELAGEMREFLLPGSGEYTITLERNSSHQERYSIFGENTVIKREQKGVNTNQFTFRGGYRHEINGTIESEKGYETDLKDGNLTMEIRDVGNETVSGVTEEDLGSTFDVSVGNRTEWRFVSYEDELRGILNETESVEGESPGDVVISLDTNESEVAEYFNRLQEAPTGRTFIEVSPEDIQKYNAEFEFEYHDGRIDLAEDEAKLFVSAETENWAVESEIGEGIQDE